jgi:hypothetical protein
MCCSVARVSGCPWDERTCRFAAEGGHLDILKWARKNGCPWDFRTCANATFEGIRRNLSRRRERW